MFTISQISALPLPAAFPAKSRGNDVTRFLTLHFRIGFSWLLFGKVGPFFIGKNTSWRTAIVKVMLGAVANRLLNLIDLIQRKCTSNSHIAKFWQQGRVEMTLLQAVLQGSKLIQFHPQRMTSKVFLIVNI